jgi:uncharacterized protein (TIGR00661 family)
MRILYGVQATGQGHISRARAMAGALRKHPVQVEWLFSGRSREKLFDMQPFGDYHYRQGLSFATRNGRIHYLETARRLRPLQFLRDIRELDVGSYDLVVTDFEPVTAWAGKLAGVQTVGIGHQYAFGAHTPRDGHNWLSEAIMRNFAPVTHPLGLHWYPYGNNVLPPILDLPELPGERGEHVLVYLPFEDQESVCELLRQVPEQLFVQYASGLGRASRGNVEQYPASIEGFKQHLARSRGVLCNSGFELISECLHWGKPVLTKPLHGQMEQMSNALALEQLGYARRCSTLTAGALRSWLEDAAGSPAAIRFPDVAAALAAWLASGCRERSVQLVESLWPNRAGAVTGQGNLRTGPATTGIRLGA